MADEPGSVFPGFSDFVDRLVEERLALGLSQTEVAARMGTSQSAVARLERGDADVRLSTLQRYAAALERRVDFGLTGRDHSGGDDS
jgi:transcriptional regulator with XRE-family HTH domain